MACRLFRELRLGLIADPMTEVAFSTVVCPDMDSITQQQCGWAHELGARDDANADTGQRPTRHLERYS